MSIKILESLSSESVSATVISQSMRDASEELTNTFNSIEIPEYLTKSVLSGNLTNEAVAVTSTIEESLTPVIREMVGELSSENITENDIDIATQAGLVGAMLAADVPSALRRTINQSQTTESVKAVGFDGDAITVKSLAKECFKTGINENMVEHSCRFNLQAVGPNEFVSNVAPIILFNPAESGLRCSIEIIYIQDDVTHKISGDIIDFNRRTLVHAISDPTILGDRSRRIVPIVRTGGGADDSTDKFLDNAEIAWENVTVDGATHQTGFLKTSTDINMIGIGQSDPQVSQGAASTSDVLNAVGNLTNLAVRLDAGVWLDIPVEQYSRSNFFKSKFGESTGMSVNLSANTVLTANTKLTSGAVLSTHIAELDSATNGGFDYRVFVRVGATGDADIQSGTTNVTGTSWNVTAIYDQNDNLVDLTAGDGLAIKVAIEGASPEIAKCRIRGFKTNFTMANLNHKRRGDLIGKVIYSEEMWVPYLEPITCAREIGGTRDPEEVDTLIRTVHAAMDNAVVDLLLNTSLAIQSWQDLSSPDLLPETLGIARHIIKPNVITDNLDVSTMIIGITSAERHADISAVIINALRTAVYRMWIKGGMGAAKSALGISGRKERIVIAADPEFAQYLYTIGDTRLLGEEFDYKIVYSENERFKGKLMAIPSNPVVDNKVDCLRFAHTAYSPETVMNLDLSIHGGAENVLSVYPRYKPFVCNPLMVDITISNIDAAYAP